MRQRAWYYTRVVADPIGLQALLDSGELQKEEKSINRFMQVLSTLYRDDPVGFTQATEIKGRKRVYFSRDPEALRASGSTTSRRLTFCRQFIRAVFSCPT